MTLHSVLHNIWFSIPVEKVNNVYNSKINVSSWLKTIFVESNVLYFMLLLLLLLLLEVAVFTINT